VLGAQRWAALQRLLISRAVAWAAQAAPGAVFMAVEPVAAVGELGAMVGGQAEVFALNGAGVPGRMAGAVARVEARTGGRGPLLIVWPELPRWRPELADAAITDLAEGCDLSVGPVFDGGFYLLALARVLPALFALPGSAWHGADALGVVLGLASQGGIASGLLRAERALRAPADRQAALADPLLDAELRSLLQ
jgi:glycosyltransferase A (GT-A) superfamily protein (DUF2064 family)